jgi:hypothetical protein
LRLPRERYLAAPKATTELKSYPARIKKELEAGDATEYTQTSIKRSGRGAR